MSTTTIPTEWKLDDFYNGLNDPKIEADRKKWENAVQTFANTWKERTDYTENPETLREALDEYEQFCKNYGAEYDEAYYFWLLKNLNLEDPEIKARFNKVHDFSTEIENNTRFFDLNLSQIPVERQTEFLEHPKLAKYKHYLTRTFQAAKHTLSEKEEKIMALKAKSASQLWRSMVSEFLSSEEAELTGEDGKKTTKSFSEIMSLFDSQNKEIRDKAANIFNDILKKHARTAEAEINALLGDKKVNDELRNYNRPDAARHLADDVESETVDALQSAVESRYDISKRYYKLKAALMNQKTLAYHERNIPYGSVETTYTYEESVTLVQKVLAQLDPEFETIFKTFVENGRIDAYPRKGKRGGAFCVHFLPTQPTYILLNHTEKLNDVSTLAHEVGHGINNELIKKHQHALYFGTPLSTAEVASIFMEDFVLDEIEKEADEEMKLTLLMQRLNDNVSTIIRQIACYSFEKELHKTYREKGFLSHKEIGTLFQKHMSAYMGESVEQSEGSENWWIYWGHIRRYFYNYSYASGCLIAKALQERVRKDPTFITQVKEFLSAGLSQSPRDIFKKMGITITEKTFWETGLSNIDEQLKEAETLAKKLGKL